MSLRLGVDFDGTLVAPGPGGALAFRPGALEALTRLKASGHQLVLHSCRCNPMDPGPTIDEDVAAFYETGVVSARVVDQWARFEEMRTFLQAAGAWGLFDEVWQAPGKPLVDAYIDDKAELPNWGTLARELVG